MGNESRHSDKQVLTFILTLCFICGLILSLATFGLQKPQEEAKEFDRNKQMLVAAKILSPLGHFIIVEGDQITPAFFDPNTQTLMKSEKNIVATEEEIKKIASSRLYPLLTDDAGNVTTFQKSGLSLEEYLKKSKKEGYAHLSQKLFYAILPEGVKIEDIENHLDQIESVIIPISGFGLWAPIYGYLAIRSDGNTVIGTTFYEHGETPGLGANITEAWWQNQFFGKFIFQESPEGKVDFAKAPLGIVVVKGKVRDVFGTSPKAKSAVDGISGATVTGDGVTSAYKNTLEPYRALLIRFHGEKHA